MTLASRLHTQRQANRSRVRKDAGCVCGCSAARRLLRALPPAVLIFAIALVALVLVGGCSGELNSEDGLIGVEPLPALTEQSEATVLIDETSTTDRNTWPTTTVQIAVRQTQTHPTYFDTYRLDRDTEFPTAITALEAPNDESNARKEAALNVVLFPYDLLRTPIQMIGGRLPRDAERSPLADEWYGALPDAQPGYSDRWRVRDETFSSE